MEVVNNTLMIRFNGCLIAEHELNRTSTINYRKEDYRTLLSYSIREDKTVKDDNYTILDALLELTNSEIAFRDERARKINITVSSFLYHKTINDFDFSYQASINKEKILDLASLRFMEKKENIILMVNVNVI